MVPRVYAPLTLTATLPPSPRRYWFVVPRASNVAVTGAVIVRSTVTVAYGAANGSKAAFPPLRSNVIVSAQAVPPLRLKTATIAERKYLMDVLGSFIVRLRAAVTCKIVTTEV